METIHMETTCQKLPTIEHAKAICEIRDRLWNYASKNFRRWNESPRSPDELVEYLLSRFQKLTEAEAEAARPISQQEIEDNRRSREEINARPPRVIKFVGVLERKKLGTDDDTIVDAINNERQAKVEHLQSLLELQKVALIPVYESDYQPRHWIRLSGAGLIHDDMVCDPAAALAFLETKPPSRNEAMPVTLEALIDKVKKVIQGLTANGARLQDADKHPSVTRLKRAAWRMASPCVQKRIESLFAIFRIKRPTIHDLFALVEEYTSEGLQSIDRRIEEAKESQEDFFKAQCELLRKAEEKRQKQLSDLQALKKMTPQEREAAAHTRKLKRFEKRAKMIEEAMSKGVLPTSSNSCLFCGHGLHDPVSEMFGVGPDCRSFVVRAVGEQKALVLLEELKAARKPQQPEAA